MKEYFSSVITITFFLCLIDGILPKSKNGKVVKNVIAILSVTIILSPILNIFNSNLDLFNNTEILNNYSSYLIEYKKTTMVNEISYLLENNGYDVLSVEIKSKNDGNIIQVFLLNNGINDQNEHIDSIENAKNLILERLYLDNWEVLVEYKETKG